MKKIFIILSAGILALCSGGCSAASAGKTVSIVPASDQITSDGDSQQADNGLEPINKNTDEEENSNSSSYEKIALFLKNDCQKVFSPYYELLDFKLSAYQEEVVNEKIEAVFVYTVIHKNYDKDPDTVGYIKAAKESNDPHYQQLYDEYLAPKEMNFELKAIIDEKGIITLYSNISPHGTEWEPFKMADCILSNPS